MGFTVCACLQTHCVNCAEPSMESKQFFPTLQTIHNNRIILSVCNYLFASSCNRIYLSYHSISQVFYGVVLGALLGGVWFTVIQVS